MKTEIAEVKEDKALEASLRSKIESINIIDVVDAPSYEAAGENVKAIVAFENAWTDYWEPLRKAARSVVDMILEKKGGPLVTSEQKKKAQKAVASKWFDEQERKRMEEQRAAEAAARKRAEDEALAEAAALEKIGTPEAKAEAVQIIEAPVVVPSVVVRTAVPSGYGGMVRKTWKAEVVDIKALARAVLAGQVPELALQGNSVFIGQSVRALKESMRWPGVKTWAE